MSLDHLVISKVISSRGQSLLRRLPFLSLMFVALTGFTGMANAQGDSQPNILLITADDMGYTDIASFGGEIRTPNLDTLALTGVRLTNFHVGPACSQTRTMLMSGTYTEVGGITGSAAATPLQPNVVALPQLLKDAGYSTYMSGKWHLGSAEGQTAADDGFDLSLYSMEEELNISILAAISIVVIAIWKMESPLIFLKAPILPISIPTK